MNDTLTKTPQIAITTLALAIAGCATTKAPEAETASTKATVVRMTAKSGAAADLDRFLIAGRDIVAETEPGTRTWYSLDGAPDYVIFDTFVDEAARGRHFSGQVAGALKASSDDLVKGGWSGVLGGVEHYRILAETDRRPGRAKVASYVPMTAAPGQRGALLKFLEGGRDIVAKTEPGTLHWLALQSEANPDRFLIVDFFVDAAARDAHFAGKVAAALKGEAPTLVKGGWDDGVLAGARHYDVDAVK